MDYIECIQKSLDYIEDNLESRLTLDELARISLCSTFHFHRLFSAIVGISVMEYVRKRRLTVAAMMLITTRKSIIQIALETGFESHAAFTRAFKKLFGTSPKEYRNNQAHGVLFNKIDVRGRMLLDSRSPYIFGPRIIKKSSFNAIGMKITCSYENNKKDRAVPVLWENLIKRYKEIPEIVGYTGYGVSIESKPGRYFNYVACFEVIEGCSVPQGMQNIHVPSGRYAAFSFIFDWNIQRFYDALDYIYGIWLPNSNYLLADHIDLMEVIDFTTKSKNTNGFDIWLPIKA